MNCVCAVCQDPFDAAVGIVTTKCGHVFHRSCIHQWLDRSSTCPECRKNVVKRHLKKLFFNTSFDDVSGTNVSLDTLKEDLHRKDTEIQKLKVDLKDANEHFTLMCNLSKESDNELSYMKREMQKLNRIKAKNQKLLEDINKLQRELEHLNDVKTIVEGSYHDAQHILHIQQIQVKSKKGKECIGTMGMYCSAMKHELTCAKEEKKLLIDEITKVRRQMAILQENHAKKLRQLEEVHQFQNFNFPLSQNLISGSSILKNDFPQCHFCLSPLVATPTPFDFPQNKRQKVKIEVLDSDIEGISIQEPATSVWIPTNFPLPSSPENEDSVSRVKFGGHGHGVKRPFSKN